MLKYIRIFLHFSHEYEGSAKKILNNCNFYEQNRSSIRKISSSFQEQVKNQVKERPNFREKAG